MEFNGPPEHIPTFDISFERALAAGLVKKIPVGNAQQELERDSLFRKVLDIFGRTDASPDKKTQILEDLENEGMTIAEFNNKHFESEPVPESVEVENEEVATA